MRIKMLPKMLPALALLALTLVPSFAQSQSRNAAKMLPEQLGDFRAAGAPRASAGDSLPASPEDFGVVSQARREYVSGDGRTFNVTLLKTSTDAGAYSLLTFVAAAFPPTHSGLKLNHLGTAGISGPSRAAFFKSGVLFDVSEVGGPGDGTAATNLARLFAEGVNEGEGVPVLLLHLPEWEKTHASARYAVSLGALRQAAPNRPVLDAVSFEGGAEAVTARYGESQLVVVEFTTPQHAVDADAAINARLAQLRGAGQPVPTFYKRVGNYSVFVFDAKDADEAARLAGGVRYEKDVRWLGRNPHGDAIAQRVYTNTMTSMVVTVFKTSGLAIVLCLGVGAVFGGIIFMRRRARVSSAEAYSDGGEMLRLNLAEDVRAPHPSVGVLGSGKE